HSCHFCGKKFATRWCMNDHIDWDHLKIIKYQCSICFKPFKTAKIMVAHMNNIHEGKNKREPDGEHLCEICGKSYKTVKRLKGHVWAMHTNRSESKSFKCPLCPATFSWQTSIYKHIKMMHYTKRLKISQQPRVAAKKPEPYPGIELANRMQYFQQNIAGNLAQNVPPPLDIVHSS
ncbi:jg2206, partial [Pararge aegeria aegeria]